MPCLNCNDGAAHYAASDDARRCLLCGFDFTDRIRRSRMLRFLTNAKLDELDDLLKSYRQLRTLGSPLRATLIGSAISALQAVLALERQADDLPPLETDEEEEEEASDAEDEGEEAEL